MSHVGEAIMFATFGDKAEVQRRKDAHRVASAFGEMDANHDNKVSREEWKHKFGSDKMFDKYDLNGDGVVDAEELMTHFAEPFLRL